MSVIVLARECEDTIAKSIESLLGQTAWEKWEREIIVVVNGSTDRTEEVARRYPVKVLVSEMPLGHAGAANWGYQESNGDIVFPAFGDAHYAPDFVELCAGHLVAEKEAGSAYGFDLQWTDGTFLSRYLERARIIAKINYKPFSGWFFRRTDLRKLGLVKRMYDEGVVGPDVKLAQQVKSLGYRLVWEPSAKYWHGRDYNSMHKVFVKGFNIGLKLFAQLASRHTYSDYFYQRLVGIGVYFILILISIFDLNWLMFGGRAALVATELLLPYAGFTGLALREVIVKKQRLVDYRMYILVYGLVNWVRYAGMAIGFYLGPLLGQLRKKIPY